MPPFLSDPLTAKRLDSPLMIGKKYWGASP